ncbi:FTR1 family protein [Patescibacteria group bacterium]|nr:FTR1 family protein [Patescibacteria group bacterium]
MFTTAIIAFREFLEAFLIVGVFLGISKKLKLKREMEIVLATLFGVVLSLFLASVTYMVGDKARTVFTEENADILESYLLVFSGLFIAYVVFSLHNVVRRGRRLTLLKAHNELSQDAFDVSLFFTIVFLVLREGFETALFTASVSLFSAFSQNFIGLLLGFAGATICGLATLAAYIRFPIGKVFKVTEYMIILLGASLTQHGLTQMLAKYFHLDLSIIFSFNLQFLPGEDTFIGHLLQGFLGVDRGFSLPRLIIMFVYFAVIYTLFVRQRKKVTKVYH